MNENITVKVSQATSMIAKLIKAKLVPILVGSPAVGKSAIAHQIAENYGLKVIDLLKTGNPVQYTSSLQAVILMAIRY